MKPITSLVVGLALAGALSAAPAQAQRVFVAAQGSDSNPCTFGAPCRTFQHAHDTVAAGGEIDVLDPAGYGSLTINKAISIQGHGFSGISVASGGTAITINAGATDAVNLNGLLLDGAGVGLTGIQFNSGQSLAVENCAIRHMAQDGIDSSSTTATSVFTMSNSLAADNGRRGIFFRPTGSATAMFNRVEVNNNAESGVVVEGSFSAAANTVNATLFESVAAGNASVGFYAATNAGNAPTRLMISHSVSANNGYGVFAEGLGTTTIRLANSTVTGNTVGWAAVSAGVLDSYGDNYIDGNVGNEGPPPIIAPK